jgi:hypothetical protein
MAKPTAQQKLKGNPLDAAFMHATGKSGKGVEAHWNQSGDWEALGELLAALESVGGAVMLGRTRDGGQLTVALYHNGEKQAHYFDNQTEALVYVRAVVEVAGAL